MKPIDSVETAGDGEQAEAPPGATGTLDPATLTACVEAALLTADRALALGRLSQTLIEAGMPEASAGPADVRAAIEALNAHYVETGRAFRVEQVAGGYRVMTLGEFAPVAAAVRGARESTRLSRAAIETLAIVAYRQPITRVDIETIRGSATGEVLKTLLEKRLVTIVGRAEELGRPMLYGTTKRFLEVFGLASVKDLPPVGEAFPGVDPAKVRAAKPAPDPEAPATTEAADQAAPDQGAAE